MQEDTAIVKPEKLMQTKPVRKPRYKDILKSITSAPEKLEVAPTHTPPLAPEKVTKI